MFQLLVVDDEAITVNYMAEAIAEWGGLEGGQIQRAYNGPEAYERALAGKIDILLTDIRMPVMDGLELAERVKRLWPRCKVIFLTGHTDFEYAQAAIRQGGNDYVLKTEGDETILAAISRACVELRRELMDSDALERARTQYLQWLPSLQRNYLQHYLRGEPESAEARTAKFNHLQMPLDAQQPVQLVLGSVEEWGEYATYADKSLIVYAIGNITEEQVGGAARVLFMPDEKLRLAWLFQPCEGDSACAGEQQQRPSFGTVVQAAMQTIQETCRQLLRLPVSLAVGHPCSWEQVGLRFDSLLLLLRSVHAARDGETVLLTEGADEWSRPATGESLTSEAEFRLRMRKLEALESELDQGDEIAFVQLFDALTTVDESQLPLPKRKYVMMEMFSHLTSFFLAYLNRRELIDALGEEAGLDKHLLVESYASWPAMIAYFRGLGIMVARRQSQRNRHALDEIVLKVNRHVAAYLHEDLSLNRLAEIVYLSPYYLSRMYKQKTGLNLLDYITDVRIAKAKELLKTTQLKVQEISLLVGIESPPYFNRLFKKAVNCTPQEYRSQS